MFKENGTIDERIEDLLNYYLDDGMSFEEFLEFFNLTPLDIFLNAYYSGLIDEEDLEKLPENL